MHPRSFARIGGIIMLLMGVLAFLPGLNQYAEPLPALKVNASYGLFLGLFPMNVFNKVALIVFGLAGLAAASNSATNLPRSIAWSRWVFAVMGVLAVLGLIPATNTLFGYWPLFSYEVLAHGIFAAMGAYFGFALTAKVPDMPPTRKEAKRELHHTT